MSPPPRRRSTANCPPTGAGAPFRTSGRRVAADRPPAPSRPRARLDRRDRRDRLDRLDRRSTVLAHLRGDVTSRPVVDPGLAGGLREWLEDGVSGAAGMLPPGAPPVIVDRWTLSGASRVGAEGVVTLSLARAALVRALFRQLVVTGRIGDPVVDATTALELDESAARIVEFVRCLPETDRTALHRSVAGDAEVLVSRWGPIPSGWLPRTREHISIPLAGGRIILVGTIDLLLGTPPGARSSVCVVTVRSGTWRSGHRADLHFHGLLETIRSGAPPFRLATYYTGSGEIDTEDVPDAVLTAAVRRTIDGVVRRCTQGAGGRCGR